MRFVIAAGSLLVWVVAAPMITSAQLPRPADLAGIARKLPSLDRFMTNRPLETTFDDTIGAQPYLDRRNITRQPGDMKRLPRTSNGSFILQPGLWEGTFESYCLRPATWAPGAGDGYLWARLKGARATAIGTILRGSAAHPNVPRGDIQMLLWAILSRTRVDDMPATLQAAARVLLPASEIRSVNASGFQVLDAASRVQLFRDVSGPLRQVLDIESDLRYQFSKGNANYEQIEKIAVLAGAPPAQNKNAITRGQWSRHPGGYYIRYYPDSFAEMRMQVLVPARVRVVRDQLNRIVLMEANGRKVETTYNDAVAPRTHPQVPRLKAYAFKTIRVTRRGAGGKPEVLEIKDRGYTFHHTPQTRRGVIAMLMAVASDAFSAVTGTPLEARQDWGGWAGRAERAHNYWEDAEYLRARADAAARRGDASSVDDAGDTEHYEDGIETAITGDTADRVGWIAETHEMFNEALEYAISVLDGLPGTSTTGDSPGYDPGGGVATGSGGGQTLGASGR
jgi:hypothetical protein